MSHPPIVVIGDSHTALFAGIEAVPPAWPAPPTRTRSFEVHHVGPGLAASLVERESQNNTRSKALQILERDPASTSAVLFCFGEIDCRFHIVRRLGSAAPTQERIGRSIRVTLYRYLSFLEEVVLAGFRPVVFGPVATSLARYDEPYPWPTLGTTAERNAITRDFDNAMREECNRIGISHVSVLGQLIGDNLQTIDRWYFDGVHLSQAAWPLFLEAASASAPDVSSLLDAKSTLPA